MTETKTSAAKIAVRKIWDEAFVQAIVLLTFFYFYATLAYGTVTLVHWGEIVAGAATVMIGWSFALSGFSYFFDFLDRHLGHRKQIGLMGFYLAVLYSILLLLIDSQTYFYGFFDNFWTPNFQLGLGAMAIFALMVLVSNTTIKDTLGYKKWRWVLRLGYLAYFFLLVRRILLDSDTWLVWWGQLDAAPPITLLISVYATLVFLLRGAMIVTDMSQKYLKKAAS